MYAKQLQQLTFSYDGNPGLCITGDHRRNPRFIIIAVIGASVASLILLLGCLWMLQNHRRKRLKNETSEKCEFSITKNCFVILTSHGKEIKWNIVMLLDHQVILSTLCLNVRRLTLFHEVHLWLLVKPWM